MAALEPPKKTAPRRGFRVSGGPQDTTGHRDVRQNCSFSRGTGYIFGFRHRVCARSLSKVSPMWRALGGHARNARDVLA